MCNICGILHFKIPCIWNSSLLVNCLLWSYPLLALCLVLSVVGDPADFSILLKYRTFCFCSWIKKHTLFIDLKKKKDTCHRDRWQLVTGEWFLRLKGRCQCIVLSPWWPPVFRLSPGTFFHRSIGDLESCLTPWLLPKRTGERHWTQEEKTAWECELSGNLFIHAVSPSGFRDEWHGA